MDNYYRLNITNGNLHRTNERLTRANEKLKDENETLRAENKDYKLLRKVFGRKQMDNLLEQALETEQSKKRERFRKNQYESKVQTYEKAHHGRKNRYQLYTPRRLLLA